MKTKSFTLSGRCQYLGRNGLFKTDQISVVKYSWSDGEVETGCIRIYPVNSRGCLARCFVEVPLEDVDEFISALKQVRR